MVIDGVTHSLLYRASQFDKDSPVVEGIFLEPFDVMFPSAVGQR